MGEVHEGRVDQTRGLAPAAEWGCLRFPRFQPLIQTHGQGGSSRTLFG